MAGGGISHIRDRLDEFAHDKFAVVKHPLDTLHECRIAEALDHAQELTGTDVTTCNLCVEVAIHRLLETAVGDCHSMDVLIQLPRLVQLNSGDNDTFLV